MPISDGGAAALGRPFHWLGLLAVAVAALAADQLTKQIVVTQLAARRVGRTSSAPFTIHHVDNPGIAFGLFASWAGIVTFLTAGAVIWMLFYFARRARGIRCCRSRSAC